MSQVSSVNATQPSAYFNAVKIKISEPKANLPESLNTLNANGEFNAVNIELDKPELGVKQSSLYDYPVSEEMVTYAQLYPSVGVIALPETTEEISDEVLAEAGVDNVESEIPEPNFTTLENEKKKLVTNTLSFRGKNNVNIIPGVEVQPRVDIGVVTKNLKSDDLDIQALQIAEIFNAIDEDFSKAQLYLTPVVFEELIGIVNKDTSKLAGPTDEQKDLRSKIIANELMKEDARLQGKELKDEELPYNITKSDIDKAIKLSPMEQAERNKEYGILCLAVLGKIYSEDFEKQNGTVLQITDMPGASEIVKVLKDNENPGLQHTAMDALTFLYRPEYDKEMKAIFKIAAKNQNKSVAEHASLILSAIEKQ